jgi:hypothetical protein
LGLCAGLLWSQSARAETVCQPGDPAECADLRDQCFYCVRHTPRDIDGNITCDVCADASACRTGYRVLESWQVRVGHDCRHISADSGCYGCTGYSYLDAYAVSSVEVQYWETRQCYDWSAPAPWTQYLNSQWESGPNECWSSSGGWCPWAVFYSGALSWAYTALGYMTGICDPGCWIDRCG